MVKMTFTFDQHTAETLRRTAARLNRPQSFVVREAIQEYASRADRLSDEERRQMIRCLIAWSPDRRSELRLRSTLKSQKFAPPVGPAAGVLEWNDPPRQLGSDRRAHRAKAFGAAIAAIDTRRRKNAPQFSGCL